MNKTVAIICPVCHTTNIAEKWISSNCTNCNNKYSFREYYYDEMQDETRLGVCWSKYEIGCPLECFMLFEKEDCVF
jgi:hypothetical protein